jgi:hypothetical protein
MFQPVDCFVDFLSVPIFTVQTMKRFMTILLMLLSISFVTAHFFKQYIDAGQELVQDDGAGNGTEEERDSQAENDKKAQHHSLASTDLQVPAFIDELPISYYYALLSSGYSNNPFTPPDF